MSALLARTALLIAVASGLGVGINAFRSDGVRVSSFEVASSCTAGGAPASVPGAVAVVDAHQATRMCGDPGVMLADVRPSARFAAGHIADAVHLPCASSAAASSGALAQLARKHTVVVYGDSADEARPVAEALRARLGGVSQVLVLAGGFAAWEGAGLACTSGPCPDCTRRAELDR